MQLREQIQIIILQLNISDIINNSQTSIIGKYKNTNDPESTIYIKCKINILNVQYYDKDSYLIRQRGFVRKINNQVQISIQLQSEITNISNYDSNLNDFSNFLEDQINNQFLLNINFPNLSKSNPSFQHEVSKNGQFDSNARSYIIWDSNEVWFKTKNQDQI